MSIGLLMKQITRDLLQDFIVLEVGAESTCHRCVAIVSVGCFERSIILFLFLSWHTVLLACFGKKGQKVCSSLLVRCGGSESRGNLPEVISWLVAEALSPSPGLSGLLVLWAHVVLLFTTFGSGPYWRWVLMGGVLAPSWSHSWPFCLLLLSPPHITTSFYFFVFWKTQRQVDQEAMEDTVGQAWNEGSHGVHGMACKEAL